MKFTHVGIETLAYALPPLVWTSEHIEERLAPTYERLKLPAGRLELMTGIRERRFWPNGMRPSEASAAAGQAALQQSALPAEAVEVLMHTAVCRDFMEPATASMVHRRLALGPRTQIFDVSNACLGFLNGLVLLGSMIELGQVQCGLVVAGENGRSLVESTIDEMLQPTVSRQAIKPMFASLTIGSGAVAAVVAHRDLAPHAHPLLGGVVRAATQFNDLCQGNTVNAEQVLMQTDAETLLNEGVALAKQAWDDFCGEMAWDRDTPDRIICHQVGATHRRRLYESLNLDLAKDFSTFETLGNVGSVSLPISLALAAEQGAVQSGDRVALLGIGSGINCMMLAMEW